MPHTRIKICGISRPEDADAVVEAGADALGLNFARQSARYVALDRAAAIADRVRGRVTRVGLFVDPAPEEVARVLDAVELDVLQFHGDEPGEFCRSFGVPYLKALRVRKLPAAGCLRGRPGGRYRSALRLDPVAEKEHPAAGAGRGADPWQRGCRGAPPRALGRGRERRSGR
jgi:phosphoribosylanthranilate isomerase